MRHSLYFMDDMMKASWPGLVGLVVALLLSGSAIAFDGGSDGNGYGEVTITRALDLAADNDGGGNAGCGDRTSENGLIADDSGGDGTCGGDRTSGNSSILLAAEDGGNAGGGTPESHGGSGLLADEGGQGSGEGDDLSDGGHQGGGAPIRHRGDGLLAGGDGGDCGDEPSDGHGTSNG